MSGRLGKAILAANTATDIYTVPAARVATVNVNLCNIGSAAATVRLAIRTGALTNADYIEHSVVLQPGEVLERTSIAMSAGEILVAHASTADVAVRAHGFVEAA